jgi:predicted RNase H-like nuclease (RuvC/YqgF family)
MDDMKLQHEAEVSQLRREIDGFGANEREVQRVTRQNQALRQEVAAMKSEVQRLHLSSNNVMQSPDSSNRRILQTRNEQLKGEVDKLNKKLRRMRRNVTRIEI